MARQSTSHIDDPAALGRRLRATRLERGLTQAALVFEGCTVGHVSRIEAGLRTPSLQVVHRLAELLGVDERWLATGCPAPPEPPAETLLRQARVATRLGAHGEAAAALDALAGDDETLLPTPVRARLLAARGTLAFHDGRLADAVAWVEAAFALDPGLADADAVEALARALRALGRTPEAIALLDGRLTRAERDDDPALRLRLGVLLAGIQATLDGPGAAERTLDRLDAEAASGPEGLARACWTRSRLHARAGEHETSVDLAGRALALLEATESLVLHGRAHLLRAGARLAGGEAEEGLRHVRLAKAALGAVGTRHDDALALLEDARALLALGRGPDAAAAPETALELLSGDGSTSGADGDLARARALLERAGVL